MSAKLKRGRDEGDDPLGYDRQWNGKKSRSVQEQLIGEQPTAASSVYSSASPYTRPRFSGNELCDSDDDCSSLIASEPGSPRDVSMASDDDTADCTVFSPSMTAVPSPLLTPHILAQQHASRDRVPTPMFHKRTPNLYTGMTSHNEKPRILGDYRNGGESPSSSLLRVPPSIEEDEVSTPPSAAEAAGSQLSMLSVSDVDMDASDAIPSITIHLARPLSSDFSVGSPDESRVSSGGNLPKDSDMGTVVVRKQRRRSGALSSPSSPARSLPAPTTAKKGFSMGFRADCEKCRMRVPGHMNHFIS